MPVRWSRARSASRAPAGGGARYLFYSHDGFGLGHVRRSVLLARALRERSPGAEVSVLTGVAASPAWLQADGIEVVRVPALLKGSDGAYRSADMDFDSALALRAELFREQVRRRRPHVVVVDRHPYGTAGELRAGLRLARQQDAAVVLGLRDVLDEPAVVAAELAGRGWDGVPDLFSDVLVYGEPHLVDHEREYGLPVRPTYCGWVVERPAARPAQPGLLVLAAGGGGDGGAVRDIGVGLLELRRDWRAVFAAGPYADPALRRQRTRRLSVVGEVAGCGDLFARAAAVVCMAGYNSTLEALAAGQRPILVPRRSPRREQAIRASRLAALGVADVVDEGARAAEVSWLLDQPRRLAPGALAAARIRLDGAGRAAEALAALAAARSLR